MSNLVVQTNVMALNSHRNLKTVGGKLSQASARLSSGYKINSAADDASGLAISEKMRAQIRGLDMASKNTQDGISLVQTAEGGMSEIDNMVQRIRELAVQAANDTNDFSSNDRKKIQEEIDQLTAGIDNMAGQVEFNKKKLLDGSIMDDATKRSLLSEINGKLQTQFGASITISAAVTTGAYSANLLNTAVNVTAGSGVVGMKMSLDAGALASTGYTQTVGTGVGSVTAALSAAAVAAFATSDMSSADAFDAYNGKLDSYMASLQQIKDAGGDVATQLEKAGKAKEAAREVYAANELSKGLFRSAQGLTAVDGDGLWFQTGSNSAQGIQVGLGAMTSKVLGIGDGAGNSSIKVNAEKGIPVSNTIDVIDTALQYVASQRAKMGAVQNRMEYTKASLEVSSENLSAAESRIRDTDMAKEMMKLTSANVLQQAGVSMLSQANQAPQSVLSLLR